MILGTVILGLGVGMIWTLLVRGPNPGGVILTLLLGLVGAFLGLAVGAALGLSDTDSIRVMIAPVVVAVALLAVCRAISRRARGVEERNE